jgi:hypothetical protein
MNIGDKVTIQFKGKDVECTCVQPGVVQKTPSIFYIQDSVSGDWLYCFPERLENLNRKYEGDLSHYTGRSTRATIRETLAEAKAERKTEREAVKAARVAEEAVAAVQDAVESDNDDTSDAEDEANADAAARHAEAAVTV